ncbi:MAG: hypothetical protein IIZ54_01700, partial [Selenomonadaceae bacterium]|nr:hypothetical protein [Selenomonadaceae bacterium]
VWKSIKWIDGLILGMAIWILMGIDFHNMSTMDQIYLVTFTIWIVLFVLRLFIVYRKARQDGGV